MILNATRAVLQRLYNVAQYYDRWFKNTAPMFSWLAKMWSGASIR